MAATTDQPGRVAEARERAMRRMQRLVIELEEAGDTEAAAQVAQAILLKQREARGLSC